MTYIRPLAIGSFTAANNLLLAPMAGITDSPFRVLCLKGGAGLVCAEMVSAHALHYGNAKSGRMLQINPKEHPVSMQIFGSDEATIAEAARNAEAQGADIVDLNAGCPVKKINKAGAGCVLMKDEAKLGRLVEAAVKSVKIPVTLKTRIALTHKELLSVRMAKLAENAGASAVQELGAAMATATSYLRAMLARGMDIDTAASQTRFRFSLGSNFFMEISKLRASRMLWSKVVEEFGGGDEARKIKMNVVVIVLK